MTNSRAAARYVRIWDVPTRATHWGLVMMLGGAWWSAESHNMVVHQYCGYTILGLVCFRLYWGLFGSSTALFHHFIRPPGDIWRYMATLHRRDSPRTAGHNPVGALSVIALVVLLVVQLVAGLFAVDVDGVESGPLSVYVDFDAGRLAARIHASTFNILLTLVIVHVAAVLFYLFYKRHNLIAAMLRGGAVLPYPISQELVKASAWRLVVGLALAAGLVFATSRGFRL